MFLGRGPDATAVILRHDAPDDRSLALGREFPQAGRVLPEGGCTLIGPQWALTAAHVAQSVKPGLGRVSFEGREYAVKRVVVHPQGALKPQEPPEVDLALLELVHPVDGIRPAILNRQDDEVGQIVHVVGHGDLGDGKNAPRRGDLQRRAGTNVVSDAGPLRIFLRFDKPPAGTDLEAVGGPGDSGGPALRRKGDDIVLVGVSSASMGGKPGRYGVTDVYVRVSRFVDWIEKSTVSTD